MKTGKYQNNKPAKGMALALALVLLLGCGIGGTLAWLMDSTPTVTNTFTVGNIDITLDEARVDQDGNFLDANKDIVDTLAEAERVTNNQYQAIPGKTYSKDPTLTVTKGNEKCYLFVKYVQTGDPGTYYDFDFALDNDGSGWTQGTGTDGDGVPVDVWYIIVEETAATEPNDTVYHLLVGDTIKVKDSVTSADMSAAAAAKLEWTAYAVQFMNDNTNFTPAEAWDIAQDGKLGTN